MVRISYIIQYSIESKILNRYWIISLNIFLCICLAQKNILKIKEVRIFPKKLQLWGIQPTKLQNSIANKYLLLDESNNEFLEISKNGDLTRPSGLGNNQINYGDIIWMGISNNGMTLVNRLENKINFALSNGITKDKIIIDPGFGFGKLPIHNMQITAWLPLFQTLGYPILLGASRKSSIASLSNNEVPELRLPGSLSIATLAYLFGTQILRVHDVEETVQSIKITKNILKYL